MNWFEVVDKDGLKHYLNTDIIMDIKYDSAVNVTVFYLACSGFPPIVVTGNVLKDFHRFVSAH